MKKDVCYNKKIKSSKINNNEEKKLKEELKKHLKDTWKNKRIWKWDKCSKEERERNYRLGEASIWQSLLNEILHS